MRSRNNGNRKTTSSKQIQIQIHITQVNVEEEVENNDDKEEYDDDDDDDDDDDYYHYGTKNTTRDLQNAYFLNLRCNVVLISIIHRWSSVSGQAIKYNNNLYD